MGCSLEDGWCPWPLFLNPKLINHAHCPHPIPISPHSPIFPNPLDPLLFLPLHSYPLNPLPSISLSLIFPFISLYISFPILSQTHAWPPLDTSLSIPSYFNSFSIPFYSYPIREQLLPCIATLHGPHATIHLYPTLNLIFLSSFTFPYLCDTHGIFQSNKNYWMTHGSLLWKLIKWRELGKVVVDWDAYLV